VTLIPRHLASGQSVIAFRAIGNGQPALIARDFGPALPEAIATPANDEIAALAERIIALETALESERELADEARQAAFAQGVEKGRADADSDAADRLRMFGEATAKAVAECAAAIDARGDTAVAIARVALARIFGEGCAYGPMAEAVVRHQAAQISAETVLAARVSASDFPDEDALAALAAECGGVRIESDPKLAAGSCLFELSLGTLDASVPIQAHAVDALLASLESGEGRAR
jgi:flagellar biosynthesis/type III secretory pathway protein FliH